MKLSEWKLYSIYALGHKYNRFFQFTGKAFAKRPGYTVLRTGKLFARTILGRSGKVNA